LAAGVPPALSVGLIAAGLVLLNQGAKFLTDNAVSLATRLGRSRFVIGALLVSTLAAVPEVLVSVIALEEGSSQIALGNALASNAVTLAFVIGLSALMVPIRSTREIVLRDAVFLATVTVVVAALLLDGNLSAYDGLALVALFVPYSVNLMIAQKRSQPAELDAAVKDMRIELEMTGWLFGRKVEIRAGLRWLVFGVIWAVMGAQFIVFGAIDLAASSGVSEWVLGITVVALGTSLPDIAAAYHATRKGYSDLALGEGLGACVVTSLLTLGIIGILRGAVYPPGLLVPALAVVTGTSFLLLVFMLGGWNLSRRAGAVLIAGYFVMVALNVLFFTNGGQ